MLGKFYNESPPRVSPGVHKYLCSGMRERNHFMEFPGAMMPLHLRELMGTTREDLELCEVVNNVKNTGLKIRELIRREKDSGRRKKK